MLALVGQIKQSTQLRWNRVYQFRPKISFQLDLSSYLIKTAETSQELIESFKLRHEVFRKEFCGDTKNGLDFDKYDYFFDHLIILHKESQKIIGTYRLNSSQNSSMSYTSTEFDLEYLKRSNQSYLELGRACIHKEHRKGSVISLLWRGIAEYMKLSQSDMLIGCSSLKVNSARESALIYKHLLESGCVKNDFSFSPTEKYTMDNFDAWLCYFDQGLTEAQKQEAESYLPSLLKSYLKLGAKVGCGPAYDSDFECIDLLTVLKKEDLSNSLAQRFNVVR